LRKFFLSALVFLDKVVGGTIQCGGYATEVAAHTPVVKYPIKMVDAALGYVHDNFLEGRDICDQKFAMRRARGEIRKMQTSGEPMSADEIGEIAAKHGLKPDVIDKIVAQAEAEFRAGAEGSILDDEVEGTAAPATA